jgi:hypothetical protein
VTAIALRIDPELCGPVSVGTVAVIKLLAEHLGLSLSAAMEYVDRAVFEAQIVDVPAPSDECAHAFVAAIAALPPVPRIEVLVLPSA